MKTFGLVILSFLAGAASMFFLNQRAHISEKEAVKLGRLIRQSAQQNAELRLQLDQAAERNLPLPTLDAKPLPTP